MSDSQTLVVKLGTSVLTGGSRRLNRAHIVELVRQCAQLHAAGHRIVIVTSGAIAKDVIGNIHLLPFYWITRILISFMVAVEMPISFVYTTRLAVQFQQVSVARYAKV